MSELTKKALAVSLKKLLSKKELSKITISNITDECGVNRQTFYYHFKDIYDLLEWIYKNEVIDEIDNKDELITKGAVEEILNICTTFEYKGQTEKLTNEKIENMRKICKNYFSFFTCFIYNIVVKYSYNT